MNRRAFLHTSLLASLAASHSRVLAALEPDNAYRKNMGLQLYTLRNEIKKDVQGTLKAVAEAGYKQAEMYGFPGTDEMAKAARDAGLALNSSHFEWNSVVEPKDAGMSEFMGILDKAKSLGLSHLVIPYLHDKQRSGLDAYKRVAENCNKAAVKAKAAGIQLAYHNHAFEFKPFEGGKSGFDVFVAEFGPDMAFELDLFWVKVGGADPVETLRRLSGRVSQVHLKDLKEGLKLPNFGGLSPDAFKELGNGIISTEAVMKAAKEAGVKHCHVEQDQSPNPLASIRQSMDYLRKL